MSREELLKASAEERKKINKDYGEGTIMAMSDKRDPIESISTGSLGLDIALGIGGLPKGRIVEIYGPESSGKTTISIQVIAAAQKAGGLCAIIDMEQSFDSSYAENLGVDLSMLDITQPDSGDMGLEIADRLISSGLYSVVVIDSVAALVPKSEIEKEMGESSMGRQALLMSQACRKITPIAKKTNTLVIFINQIRNTIGGYGNPETLPGGLALRFYASVRLDVRRSTTKDNSVFEGDVVTGNLTKVKVIKSKVSRPFTICEFNIIYGQGTDKINEIIQIAHDLEILKKWGKTITYKEEKYEVSVFEALLADNSDFYEDLRKQVLEKVVK